MTQSQSNEVCRPVNRIQATRREMEKRNKKRRRKLALNLNYQTESEPEVIVEAEAKEKAQSLPSKLPTPIQCRLFYQHQTSSTSQLSAKSYCYCCHNICCSCQFKLDQSRRQMHKVTSATRSEFPSGKRPLPRIAASRLDLPNSMLPPFKSRFTSLSSLFVPLILLTFLVVIQTIAHNPASERIELSNLRTSNGIQNIISTEQIKYTQSENGNETHPFNRNSNSNFHTDIIPIMETTQAAAPATTTTMTQTKAQTSISTMATNSGDMEKEQFPLVNNKLTPVRSSQQMGVNSTDHIDKPSIGLMLNATLTSINANIRSGAGVSQVDDDTSGTYGRNDRSSGNNSDDDDDDDDDDDSNNSDDDDYNDYGTYIIYDNQADNSNINSAATPQSSSSLVSSSLMSKPDAANETTDSEVGDINGNNSTSRTISNTVVNSGNGSYGTNSNNNWPLVDSNSRRQTSSSSSSPTPSYQVVFFAAKSLKRRSHGHKHKQLTKALDNDASTDASVEQDSVSNGTDDNYNCNYNSDDLLQDDSSSISTSGSHFDSDSHSNSHSHSHSDDDDGDGKGIKSTRNESTTTPKTTSTINSSWHNQIDGAQVNILAGNLTTSPDLRPSTPSSVVSAHSQTTSTPLVGPKRLDVANETRDEQKNGHIANKTRTRRAQSRPQPNQQSALDLGDGLDGDDLSWLHKMQQQTNDKNRKESTTTTTDRLQQSSTVSTSGESPLTREANSLIWQQASGDTNNLKSNYNISNNNSRESPDFDKQQQFNANHINGTVRNMNTSWQQNPMAANGEAEEEEYDEMKPHNVHYWRLIWLILPLGATFGNLLVIMAVYMERSLQSVTNYFIVSLAFADLFVGLIVMPFAVYVLVNGIWELGDTICDMFVAVDVTSSTASILNLVAISIDRYLAIAHPIAYSAGSSGNRAIFTIVCVWLISCCVGAPIILGLNTTQNRKSTLCVLYNSTFIFWSSLTSFYVPCIIMVGLYWRIFLAIRSRTKKAIQAGANQRQYHHNHSHSHHQQLHQQFKQHHQQQQQQQQALLPSKMTSTTMTTTGNTHHHHRPMSNGCSEPNKSSSLLASNMQASIDQQQQQQQGLVAPSSENFKSSALSLSLSYNHQHSSQQMELSREGSSQQPTTTTLKSDDHPEPSTSPPPPQQHQHQHQHQKRPMRQSYGSPNTRGAQNQSITLPFGTGENFSDASGSATAPDVLTDGAHCDIDPVHSGKAHHSEQVSVGSIAFTGSIDPSSSSIPIASMAASAAAALAIAAPNSTPPAYLDEHAGASMDQQQQQQQLQQHHSNGCPISSSLVAPDDDDDNNNRNYSDVHEQPTEAGTISSEVVNFMDKLIQSTRSICEQSNGQEARQMEQVEATIMAQESSPKLTPQAHHQRFQSIIDGPNDDGQYEREDRSFERLNHNQYEESQVDGHKYDNSGTCNMKIQQQQQLGAEEGEQQRVLVGLQLMGWCKCDTQYLAACCHSRFVSRIQNLIEALDQSTIFATSTNTNAIANTDPVSGADATAKSAHCCKESITESNKGNGTHSAAKIASGVSLIQSMPRVNHTEFLDDVCSALSALFNGITTHQNHHTINSVSPTHKPSNLDRIFLDLMIKTKNQLVDCRRISLEAKTKSDGGEKFAEPSMTFDISRFRGTLNHLLGDQLDCSNSSTKLLISECRRLKSTQIFDMNRCVCCGSDQITDDIVESPLIESICLIEPRQSNDESINNKNQNGSSFICRLYSITIMMIENERCKIGQFDTCVCKLTQSKCDQIEATGSLLINLKFNNPMISLNEKASNKWRHVDSSSKLCKECQNECQLGYSSRLFIPEGCIRRPNNSQHNNDNFCNTKHQSEYSSSSDDGRGGSRSSSVTPTHSSASISTCHSDQLNFGGGYSSSSRCCQLSKSNCATCAQLYRQQEQQKTNNNSATKQPNNNGISLTPSKEAWPNRKLSVISNDRTDSCTTGNFHSHCGNYLDHSRTSIDCHRECSSSFGGCGCNQSSPRRQLALDTHEFATDISITETTTQNHYDARYEHCTSGATTRCDCNSSSGKFYSTVTTTQADNSTGCYYHDENCTSGQQAHELVKIAAAEMSNRQQQQHQQQASGTDHVLGQANNSSNNNNQTQSQVVSSVASSAIQNATEKIKRRSMRLRQLIRGGSSGNGSGKQNRLCVESQAINQKKNQLDSSGNFEPVSSSVCRISSHLIASEEEVYSSSGTAPMGTGNSSNRPLTNISSSALDQQQFTTTTASSTSPATSSGLVNQHSPSNGQSQAAAVGADEANQPEGNYLTTANHIQQQHSTTKSDASDGANLLQSTGINLAASGNGNSTSQRVEQKAMKSKGLLASMFNSMAVVGKRSHQSWAGQSNVDLNSANNNNNKSDLLSKHHRDKKALIVSSNLPRHRNTTGTGGGSRRRREKNAARRERKATKTLAIVLIIFLICWTPFFTCNIIDGICIQLDLDCQPGMMVYLVTSWLGYINSCVNPIIYTIFNMEFRRAFKKLLTTKPTYCC